MKKLSKKTKKFFSKNTTAETTTLIPIVKDIPKIMHEFYEFYEIIFEEDETIQKPEKDELCRKILIQNNYKFITKYKHNEIFAIEKVSI